MSPKADTPHPRVRHHPPVAPLLQHLPRKTAHGPSHQPLFPATWPRKSKKKKVDRVWVVSHPQPITVSLVVGLSVTTLALVNGLFFFFFSNLYFSSKKTKRRRSSPSPPPKRQKRGRKAKNVASDLVDSENVVVESDPPVPFWNDKLMLLVKDKEKATPKEIKVIFLSDEQQTDSNFVFQSPGLELIIYQHSVGFPMFESPPTLKNFVFLGYFAITLHQRGIAFYATKDCPEATLQKMNVFLASFRCMYFFFISFLTMSALPLRKLQAFEKALLQKCKRRQAAHTSMSIRWWCSVFVILDEV